MKHDTFRKHPHPKPEDNLYWKEVLQSALMTGYPVGQHLERILDRLERGA